MVNRYQKEKNNGDKSVNACMSVNLHSLRNVRVEGGNGNWGWPGIREENGFVGGGGGLRI